MNIPAGIKNTPIAPMKADSKNLMKVTPTAKSVRAVRKYAKYVRSLAKIACAAAKCSPKANFLLVNLE